MLGARLGAPDAPQCEHCKRLATTQRARYGQQNCATYSCAAPYARDSSDGRAAAVAFISCVDQAEVWRGGRSKPLGMIPAAGSAGETTTVSVPLKAGVELKAEGGPAAPMQVAVQLLQVEC